MDFEEMLMIRWATDDPNSKTQHPYSEAWHKAQLKPAKQKRDEQGDAPDLPARPPPIEEPASRSQILLPKPPVDVTRLEEEREKAVAEKLNAKRMQKILSRIEERGSFKIEIPRFRKP
jgi:hypothetical protein